eukprot:CAMPEP_0197306386 /NCGR_PEP_ID=MMETSP0891-20130614/3194_1 /TAXON_ID=44058 ORGANISM="Aureoumbra lagunensis, Strain CCMP1510" /NCGR_SAMPLE_ID=MMETSP0891 /ASSEMBLY_ACC=CAM_ASM_000534 /LENGTH=158 /DNA_ID=CAMNT_0042788541 /DNA_START=132 /DNA_END=605 /DNA_ORIENTATION=-
MDTPLLNEVVSFQAPQPMSNSLPPPKQFDTLDRSVSNPGTLLKNYETLSPETGQPMVHPNFMAQASNSVVLLKDKNHLQSVIETHFKNAGHDSSSQKWMDDANIPPDSPAERTVENNEVVESVENTNNEYDEIVESDERKNNENDESAENNETVENIN